MTNVPSVDDPVRYARIIKDGFLRELCVKDREAIQNGRSNIFTIEEIWDRSLHGFSVDEVRSHVRGYSMEPEAELEFVDNIDEDRIRLTDRGRNVNCEGLV